MASRGTYQYKSKNKNKYPPLHVSRSPKSSQPQNIPIERPCLEPSPEYEDMLTQFEDSNVLK